MKYNAVAEPAAAIRTLFFISTPIIARIKNPAAALEPGVFINSFERYVLFIYRIDHDKLTITVFPNVIDGS